MDFNEYLKKTASIASEEQAVLKLLSERVGKKGTLDALEYRAARSSLQIIIENAIGKARRTLSYLNCPFIPKRAGEAFDVLVQAGAMSESDYQALRSATGFRNAMIHDYMEFNRQVLINIVKNREYQTVLDFLYRDAEYAAVVQKRIASYAP